MLTINIDLTTSEETKILDILKKRKLTISEYIIDLIINDLDSISHLGNGFYYNNLADKLYDSQNIEIKMSKIQKEILILLINSKGKIVPLEIIREVWKKEKVSIYTLRNMINAIRKKTYYKMIINRSNIGYSINVN